MSSFVTKHSKQRKTPKVIKIQWLESIWCRIGKNFEFCHKTFKTMQNSKSDQNTMTWIDLMSNCQKCRVLSQNIQYNAKLQKWSKYNDFASIWCQNDQNNAKLPNRSNYDELHWFDVELAKMSSFVTKHSKQRKTPKVIKIQWLESIWCRIGKNVEFCHKTFKTTQNYQSDQITMNCMHLTSNWQKCRVLSQNIQNNAILQKWSKYNDFASILSKWSKQRKTTKAIKLRWIAWIWRRIGKNVEFCHKTFKTTQNSKSDQNTMNCIDLTSNWSKHVENYQNDSKQCKTPKVIVELQWLCIDLMSKWSKQRKTTKSIKLRWIAWFDVELAKMSSFVTKHSKQRKTPKVIKIQWLESIWCRIGKNVEFCHKTFKTTQNYQSDQITMNCMHLTSNWQKCRVLSQNIQNNAKLQKWSKYNDFASIWCQNDQNNAKLPNWSNYDELHGFDVELVKKCRVLSQNIQNNAKLQKWSKYNDLHRFDVKMIKTTQNYQSDQITMNCMDLTSNW